MEAISSDLKQSLQMEACLKRLVREKIMPYRFINYGRNTKLSKCIGLIGPRGSGKSLSAAAIAIMDYLIPGYKVISNMNVNYPLQVGGLIAGYRSVPLDKIELMKFEIDDNVAVLVDEVNIEFSEARRSMTNRNLIFNKILQQLRKRKLNVIYTVQHEMWIDNRLRWQTDVFIKCQDILMKPGGVYLPYEFGEFISWKIYDMAGIFGQGSYYDTEKPILDGWRFGGKKWFNCFATDEIQGGDEGTYGADGMSIVLKKSGEIELEVQNQSLLFETIEDLHNKGIKEIPSSEMFKVLGVNTTRGKKYVGVELKKMGVEYVFGRKGGLYRIPETDLEKPETMKKPVFVGS